MTNYKLLAAVALFIFSSIARADWSSCSKDLKYTRGYLPIPQMRSGKWMYYKSIPAEQGKETFVLVHGNSADSSDWDQVADSLVEEGYGVVQPDLIGHGKTGERNWNLGYSARTSLEDNVNALVVLLRELKKSGIHKVRLVGHSAGAAVVAMAASRVEDLDVTGISLVAGYFRRVDLCKAAKNPALSVMTAVSYLLLGQTVTDNCTNYQMDHVAISSVPDLVRNWIYNRALRKGELLAPFYLEMRVKAGTSFTFDLMKYDLIANPPAMPKVPIQVITGDRDDILEAELSKEFVERLRENGYSVEYDIIPRGRHMLPTQDHRELSRILLRPVEKTGQKPGLWKRSKVKANSATLNGMAAK